ncbi:MAG: FGGY-family carbohydrate kinase [Anaerolineae bacterium]|nr:FGGY-family carbohydrate kinase [Anaerolineae bacterium]
MTRSRTSRASKAQAAALPPGAEGLIFLPYLSGERCPHWNADARGVVFGLSLRHGRAHFVRAIMEGVAFRMYSVFNALSDLADIHEIRASGGFIRSPLWLQIVADVFGRQIVLPDTQEMSAIGAVFMAMYALGIAPSLAATERLVRVGVGAQPDMARHARYRALFAQFETLYDHLRPDFAALAAFRADEAAAASP